MTRASAFRAVPVGAVIVGRRAIPNIGGVARVVFGIVVGVVAILLEPMAAVANTKMFRQATAKEFEEGEAAGTSILPAGEVAPGLITTRTSVDAAFVWCSVPSRDGATVFFWNR